MAGSGFGVLGKVGKEDQVKVKVEVKKGGKTTEGTGDWELKNSAKPFT